MSDSVLSEFHPAVRGWFQERFGEATPAQRLGWPAIQGGEHTLILAPTGSGKTLAAFLWGISQLAEQLERTPDLVGVQIVYVSPLKALNNDIERNLREPLAGIRKRARAMGRPLPRIRTAVRTGDTPQSARRRMITEPPHILITTPESLYLLLTSPRASAILASARSVIVDEIHTVYSNKRGVHLALSLERLDALTEAPLQRIGLSATQRPLEEVARFLGGQVRTDGPEAQAQPRPVRIIDAGVSKRMELRVITPVADLRRLPGGSIWPALVPQVLGEIMRHRTTLVFANSRRAAERAADRLNAQYAYEQNEEGPPGSHEALLVDGVVKGIGMFGTGQDRGPFQAHHGSVSREVRHRLERELKEGELPALVATSSLELGIDVGSVDCVVQLQSPRSVASGLQRVGRSGHLVGQTSIGRLFATHREDLLDLAAVTRGMLEADIEPQYTPRNCLDVLAQHVVAMASMDDLDEDALYRLVGQAYPYQDLSRKAFEGVLAMLSGGFGGATLEQLRPRIGWDRVQGVIRGLPAARMLATTNGGTIPDRGQFRVVLADGETSLGTLDEEFVYETSVGDVFTLGSATWRAIGIDDNRVTVVAAAGSMPRMPFWRGELPHRSYYGGQRYGRFRRELAELVAALPPLPDDLVAPWPREADRVIRWLDRASALDEASARNAILYVRHQLDALGAISADDTVVVETFDDALGDARMVIHSCYGARVNRAWAMALSSAMRERLGVSPECQVNDDGILFRLPAGEGELPTDLVKALGPEEARERLLAELPGTALFGAQFRMNAARALMLPGLKGGRRTPFWLQRLRAKDLLAAVLGYPDFCLVTETFRDCLHDVLDLDAMMAVLEGVRQGKLRVVTAETVVPSPVSAALLHDFAAVGIYEDDLPRAEQQMRALAVNREVLADLLADETLVDLLRPEAVAEVEDQLQRRGADSSPRTPEELVLLFRELGDLTAAELEERVPGSWQGWLKELVADERVLALEWGSGDNLRQAWVALEDYWRYRDGLAVKPIALSQAAAAVAGPERPREQAREALLRAHARTHGPFDLSTFARRYALPSHEAEAVAEALLEQGTLVRGRIAPGVSREQLCDRKVLERLHRRTLQLLRREVQPVDGRAYALFLQRWTGAHPETRREGRGGLEATLRQLAAWRAPAPVWRGDLLRLRQREAPEALLEDLCREGEWYWALEGGAGSPSEARVAFVPRGQGGVWLAQEAGEEDAPDRSDDARELEAFLRAEGAAHAHELCDGLGWGSPRLVAALRSLAAAGRVTCESVEALWWLLEAPVSDQGDGIAASSSLARDLASWREERDSAMARRRPTRRQRLRASRQAAAALLPSGRWRLKAGFGIMGPRRDPVECAAARVMAWLNRHGVLSREALEAEALTGAWQEAVTQLTQMELRGQVRRGYFVSGHSGLQYALPEALESLRATAERINDEHLVVLNACDPAFNLGLGDQSLGWSPPRLARIASNYAVFRGGVPTLAYEDGGERWYAPEVRDENTALAVMALRRHLIEPGGRCSQPRRVRVASWNDRPPVGSDAEGWLADLGFQREVLTMVWTP
ncbi:MAG: DEAD/DEAH box helicase [Anaerolineae bacterium]